jgi:hypothetical protein
MFGILPLALLDVLAHGECAPAINSSVAEASNCEWKQPLKLLDLSSGKNTISLDKVVFESAGSTTAGDGSLIYDGDV